MDSPSTRGAAARRAALVSRAALVTSARHDIGVWRERRERRGRANVRTRERAKQRWATREVRRRDHRAPLAHARLRGAARQMRGFLREERDEG
ncbi:hypothetical protein BE15_08460 [Sorangium cellulosum]|uniref:Uncharacterized protein n=1 Tax=Sorangium cellulosum TaxID=56 RepID=A0A150QGQ7_SORCE|nr:hypothetical protein BE15_08460 [Sorangium cellulosum]